MPRITGTLLDVEHYSGDFKNDQNETIAYSGTRLHVLDGREVVKIKVPKDEVLTREAQTLEAGEKVDLRVIVSAEVTRRGGAIVQYGFAGHYVEGPSVAF